MRSADEIDTCRNKQKSLYLSPSQENAYEKPHIPYLNASSKLEIVRYSRALSVSDNGIKQQVACSNIEYRHLYNFRSVVVSNEVLDWFLLVRSVLLKTNFV